MKIVGAFGTPAAEVTHLDLDRPVAAEGDQVGELARFPGAGIGVLNGVGGGFAQGDLQIFTERGGQRTRPYPAAHRAAHPRQLPRFGRQPLMQWCGQVTRRHQRNVVGRTGFGQGASQQPVKQGRGGVGTQLGRREGQVVQALVDDLTAALDQPVGIQQQARAGLDTGGRLRVRRTARNAQRAACAVDEVTHVVMRHQQRWWVPGPAPAQLSGHQVEDHHDGGGGQRTRDTRGPV